MFRAYTSSALCCTWSCVSSSSIGAWQNKELVILAWTTGWKSWESSTTDNNLWLNYCEPKCVPVHCTGINNHTSRLISEKQRVRMLASVFFFIPILLIPDKTKMGKKMSRWETFIRLPVWGPGHRVTHSVGTHQRKKQAPSFPKGNHLGRSKWKDVEHTLNQNE